MKRILGLDLGTNSIGWALVEQNFNEKQGKIIGLGSRIIPMSQDILGDFEKGNSISQTAERTKYRGTRRLYQRDTLRRERLHRVLNVLGFLPGHYRDSIDFEHKKGQFKREVKLNYKKNAQSKHEFLFMGSFNEMATNFKNHGITDKIPYDWTLYYLRTKALTQKVSKEELAWILLNFNQKRGYYQAREEIEESKKNEEFHVLKVIEVEKTEQRNNKGIWYNIHLENGWIYRRQSKDPLDNWRNQLKEFIVTTFLEKDGGLKKDKEGNIKRSFRAVDSEKDWVAIKAKTEQDIQQSGKSVGQFIYETLQRDPAQKIRGKLVKTIERKFYKDELKTILKKQIDFHEELQNTQLYKDCLEELYPHNHSHKENVKDKGFLYLFMDDIIFYQRPLKSKKSTIANCSYEFHTYSDENNNKIKRYLKGASKSNPYYQEFRLWQFLKNLKLYQREKIVEGKIKIDEDVTREFLSIEEEWVDLFDFLNDKVEIDQKTLIKYFIKKKRIEKGDEKNYHWNYVEDKKYPCNETRAQFISRLKKVHNVNPVEFLTRENEYALWHIVYSVKDKQEFEKALKTFAQKHGLDIDSFVENFKKYKPYKNQYGSYSEKTLKKLLPLMRRGKYWQEEHIPEEIKNRIADIMTRVAAIDPNKLPKKDSEREKELNRRLENIADDDVPARLIKSFIPFYQQNAMSGLNTYQACYAVYGRHSEVSNMQYWKMPGDIDGYLKNFKQHSLRNPIVEQVVTETLRVVRDIWQHYGKSAEKFFDEIHIELGREMKNDSQTRERITNQNTERENTNFRIKKLLEEMSGYDARPYSPSHQEILKLYEEGVFQNPKVDFSQVEEKEVLKIREKISNRKAKKSEIIRYKLWLEQGYLSPYTGKPIALSGLFSDRYQIDHIIPQSRYFDDSLNNKVICERAVNEVKSDQTAYEFIKKRGGDSITLDPELKNSKSINKVKLLKLEAYEAHCKQYFKKNKIKLKNLLSEDIPEGFINRQLNDSRYISKLIKGLLSNIVREEGEREAISKHVMVMPGAITSRLKHDWGLEDKWNELVAPRFKRLNNKMKSGSEGNKDYGFFDSKINAFRCKVPETIAKGFSKKRIDHRHHALDALVIACTTKDHINYITSLNTEKKNYSLVSKLRAVEEEQITDKKTGRFKMIKKPKAFHKPWNTFTIEAKSALERMIISFKQNQRIINRTNNYYQKWVEEDGIYKKKQLKQEGKNFAIRKSLHKETFLGEVSIKEKKKNLASLSEYLERPEMIVNKEIRNKVKKIRKKFNRDLKAIKEHLKKHPVEKDGKPINRIEVYEQVMAYASRKALSNGLTRKQAEKITDSGIRKIINNHLKNYTDNKSAFLPEGIEQMNKDIKQLNDGKPHQPIYHVRLYEESKKKFHLGYTGNKKTKYAEAAKGTNLFFAIYWDEDKKTRVYETVPLHDVIEYQKQQAKLSKDERKAMPLIPIDHTKGKFLFSLSPNDLVYIPTDEEMENPDGIDFNCLDKDQVNRIYKMVSTTQDRASFRQANIAGLIETYTQKHKFGELGNQNKMKTTMCEEKYNIAARCMKLKIDRLGNIKKVIKKP